MKPGVVLLLALSIFGVSCSPKPASNVDPVLKQAAPIIRELVLTNPAMKGDDISDLQQKLKYLSIKHADEEPGRYGEMTVLAVKEFQREFGFAVNGIIRQAEWNALFAPGDVMAQFTKDLAIVNGYALQDPHWARRMMPPIQPGPYLQANADVLTDGHVLKAAMLFAQEDAAHFSTSWGVNCFDDRRIYFENYTNNDSRMYYSVGQKVYSIRDGLANEVNLKSRDAEHLAWAVSTVSNLAEKQEAAAPQSTGPVLSRQLKVTQPRMNGEDVLQLQKKLVVMHFREVGEADGWYGPKTEEAVKRLQHYFGFLPDGVVNERLWSVLFSPEEVVGRLGSDIASINEYVLENPKYNGDFNPGPYGRTDVTWYVDGDDFKYILLNVFENTDGFESESTDGSFTKSVWELYPLGDRFLAIETVHARTTSTEVDSPQTECTVYYSVGGKAYAIRYGLVMSQDDYDSHQLLNWASTLPKRL
jgi:peptidoglycan hydrolase-like protein with peptidoglycan-binding domain